MSFVTLFKVLQFSNVSSASGCSDCRGGTCSWKTHGSRREGYEDAEVGVWAGVGHSEVSAGFARQMKGLVRCSSRYVCSPAKETSEMKEFIRNEDESCLQHAREYQTQEKRQTGAPAVALEGKDVLDGGPSV